MLVPFKRPVCKHFQRQIYNSSAVPLNWRCPPPHPGLINCSLGGQGMAQWPEKGIGIRLLPNENLDSFYIYYSCPLPIYYGKNTLYVPLHNTQDHYSSHSRISSNQCALLCCGNTLVFWINSGSRIISSTVLCFFSSFHSSLPHPLHRSLFVFTK